MAKTERIAALDIARTLALLGMLAFHLTFDLQMFGYLPPDTIYQGFWFWFARLIAGSFLFLAGVSLWLAHGQGLRWPAFARRLAIITAAAGLVGLGTWAFMGEYYVRFGILHSIALCSLLGLIFLRLPAALTLIAAALAFIAPSYLRDPFFDHPALVWLGLRTEPFLSVDYVPLFPWLAPFLAGLALAKLATQMGLWQRLQRPATPLTRALSWPGQHSLPIYLIHQPVLIGLFNLWIWLR
ncbi:heparan-alpha-glucosaminide N-acetyltransferase [Neogemmobacter tilapiae]|uniref:Heparan-alpha-glucosaminide N-acetyltransferase catalytic domain-containing protein n=1 Tax=Neogemmobacter tilapiae TaxID=875041 RepID=A0A918TNM1_9RHOB|nr:heparan-alpha-glucosaminide N-acetyltransferase [Gemmobacter tilapiae]GHC56297.1 hypothetical protein GCM10007315_19510 [Gemmobacter tilapiae]